MRKYSFRGGIHPDDEKAQTRQERILPALAGDHMYYALSQHIGVPSVPVVSAGERVLAGQKIADAGGAVSACLHASVSGTVKGICKMRLPSGERGACIEVENDHLMEEIASSPRPLSELTREEILARIREAGIVGMGGAGFPTHVKLAPKDPEAITHVLINGAECEPYLSSDYRRMLEEPEKLLSGIRVLLRLFTRARCLICIEDNKPACIESFMDLTAMEERIGVCPLRTKYPQGAERMLIFAATGKKIHSRMLPADAGCIVCNVDTVTAAGEAVLSGRPLTGRIVTVSGDAIRHPGNFLVPIGMTFRELAESAGGVTCEPEKVLAGGPMMGRAVFSLDVPVIKTSSALLFLSKDAVRAQTSSACINCGRCMEVCPGRVYPSLLSECAARGDTVRFQALDGMECCECGCCSVVCPAKRQVAQAVGSMRRMILANRKKA